MKARNIKPVRWCVKSSDHAFMRKAVAQNLEMALRNPNENWMAAKLNKTGLKWTRQAQWGFRIFDFWCAQLGIAVEVDGMSHESQKDWDKERDTYNFRRSGIIVLRVKNRCEDDAKAALRAIENASSWDERRDALGLKCNTKKGRRRWVTAHEDLLSEDDSVNMLHMRSL